MPVVRANGIDIWYEMRGAGPALALSHGWLGPTEDWPAGILDGLAARMRVLVYDVRGHGFTTAPEDPNDYSLPVYAQDLRALLDELDIERAHIAGVSQGGMIAAQFAVDHPERTRSLLLCDSTAGNGLDEGPGGAWERRMADGLALMREIATARGLPALAEIRIAHDREHEPRYFEHPEPPEQREERLRRHYATLPLHAFLGTSHALLTRPDLTAGLRDVRAPALVLACEWDDFLPCAERDHRLLEGSRFVLVRRAAHSSPSWRPDAFLPAVTDFVADVEAGRDVAGRFEL
jgi:3-oxoadipate enol-lactonase